MGINDCVKHSVKELERPGVVYARVFPNGDYDILRNIVNLDAWLKESEDNRIAWDPASYFDSLLKGAWKEAEKTMRCADVPVNLYDGLDYRGGYR